MTNHRLMNVWQNRKAFVYFNWDGSIDEISETWKLLRGSVTMKYYYFIALAVIQRRW